MKKNMLNQVILSSLVLVIDIELWLDDIFVYPRNEGGGEGKVFVKDISITNDLIKQVEIVIISEGLDGKYHPTLKKEFLERAIWKNEELWYRVSDGNWIIDVKIEYK